MEALQRPPETVDKAEGDGDGNLELSGLDVEPAPMHFWRALLASIAAHSALGWLLDAIPVRTGEALVLRWLRALAEHPIRGPLGLALACVAVLQLRRALFRRTLRP